MKNIHVLPTDKPSRLVKIKDNLWYTTTENIPGGVYQHIYITNDEEILVRDYYISSHEASINQCFDFNKETLNKAYWAKKVILTTDQDLIKDGVQPIDDEFLEWFVKNPSCEEVEVNHFGMCCSNQLIAQCINCNQYNPVYKIIIPKEPKQEWTPTQGEQVWIKVFSNWSSGTYIGYDTTKHIHLVRENEEGGGNLLSSSKILPYKSMPNEPKQETLEEAAENYALQFLLEDEQETDSANRKHAFKEGAKWQAERRYSEEEVLNILQEFKRYLSFGDEISQAEWFEQFKKK